MISGGFFSPCWHAAECCIASKSAKHLWVVHPLQLKRGMKHLFLSPTKLCSDIRIDNWVRSWLIYVWMCRFKKILSYCHLWLLCTPLQILPVRPPTFFHGLCYYVWAILLDPVVIQRKRRTDRFFCALSSAELVKRKRFFFLVKTN